MSSDTITGTTNIVIPKQRKHYKGTILPDFTGCSFLNLETYSIDSQTAIDKGSAGITTTKQPWTFKFLIPENFQESIQHTWADYSSFTSNFASRFVPLLQQISGAASGLGNILKSSSITGSTNYKQLSDTIGTAEGATSMRFDAALTYQTSQRRRYMFELNFADCGDPYEDIIYPIKLLEWLSSASVKSGFAQITTPYIFKVYTSPTNFITMRYAALEAILPNYQGPYRNGYPSFASVQFSFVELDPLYKTQFATEVSNAISSNSTVQQSSTAEVVTAIPNPANPLPNEYNL